MASRKQSLSIRLTAMSHEYTQNAEAPTPNSPPRHPILWDQPYYPPLAKSEHIQKRSKKLGIKRTIKKTHKSTPQRLGKCPKKALNLLCRVHTAGHCNQSCPPDTQIQEIKLFNAIFPLHNLPFLYGYMISQTPLPPNDRF